VSLTFSVIVTVDPMLDPRMYAYSETVPVPNTTGVTPRLPRRVNPNTFCEIAVPPSWILCEEPTCLPTIFRLPVEDAEAVRYVANAH